MATIPQIVRQAAEKEGFNSVHYACDYKGAKVYEVGIVDQETGVIEPIGPPPFLLLKNNQVRFVDDDGKNALYSRLCEAVSKFWVD